MGDECVDMISTSAEGSVPVSPDRSFGPGLLPHAELVSPHGVMGDGAPFEHLDSVPRETPQLSVPFLPGSTTPQGPTAPGVPCEIAGAANKWYGEYTTALQFESSANLPSGNPALWKGSGPAPGLELPVPTAGDHDRRDQYIQQLEAENRYMRACLQQYLGPAAGTIFPTLPGQQLLLQPQQVSQQCATPFFSPPEVSFLAPPTSLDSGGSATAAAKIGQLPFSCSEGFSEPVGPAFTATVPLAGARCVLSSTPSMSGTSLPATAMASHGLSPSAAPFWPSSQAWQGIADVDSNYSAAQACNSLTQVNTVPSGHLEASSRIVAGVRPEEPSAAE